MSSLKKPPLNVSSFTFNGDLHSLRDHPSLFCTPRFSMAIFLFISEQKNLARFFSLNFFCHNIEAALPGDPSPAPLCTHSGSLTDIPSPLPPAESHVSQPNTQLSEWAAHQQMSCLPRATKQQNISHISPGVWESPFYPWTRSQAGSRDTSMSGAHPDQCVGMSRAAHVTTQTLPGQLLFVLIDWRGLEGTQPKNAAPNAPAAIA